MSSMKQFLKKNREKKAVVAPQEATVTVATKPTKPEPAAPPAQQVVTFLCGHTKPLADFALGRCMSCRAEKRRAKSVKHLADRDARKLPSNNASFRFPPGTWFDKVTWDGELWSADLVATVNGSPERISGTGTGLEPLLRSLKNRWLEKMGLTEKEASVK